MVFLQTERQNLTALEKAVSAQQVKLAEDVALHNSAVSELSIRQSLLSSLEAEFKSSLAKLQQREEAVSRAEEVRTMYWEL